MIEDVGVAGRGIMENGQECCSGVFLCGVRIKASHGVQLAVDSFVNGFHLVLDEFVAG